MKSAKDLKGHRFGRLVVIEPTEERAGGSIVWMCICDCGNLCKIKGIPSANIRSCGCLKRALATNLGKASTTHGQSLHRQVTPEYCAYKNAKQRCTNPNNEKYPIYGGRGILFRFNSFEEWFAELGEKPEPKELHSVDRIDNDGDYETRNVRWATAEQQRVNKRQGNQYTKPQQEEACPSQF